jgi:formylmethanofuran dehydrogenase subunit C
MTDRVTLTLRSPLVRRLDAECIEPGRFAALGEREIAALELWDGHESRPLGDIFTVRGDHAASIALEGDLALLDAVGTGMSAGEILVAGDIGRAAGARMTGGTIRVEGSAGDDAGLAMAGGLIAIAANAGDRTGSAFPGASKGMSGGEIIVRGAVGRESGARMRRGTLFCGSAGEGAGAAMIAGNIIVAGALGDGAGLGNKRGSIVVLGSVRVPATYAYACTYRPPHLGLMLMSLRTRHGLPIGDAQLHGLYRRYSGDLAEIGKGEVLEWQAA